MALSIRSEYHTILSMLIEKGKKFSPYHPWPNTTIALMCIYGWIRRVPKNGDWVEITKAGRKMHAEAEVN